MMKDNVQFTGQVLEGVQKAKKRKSIKRSVTALLSAGVLVFLVLFGNIISFDGLLQGQSYKKYMRSYVSAQQDYAALKILDQKSAALLIGGGLYACELNSKGGGEFLLTAYGEEGVDGEFVVKFSKDSAVLTGETQDGAVYQVLNVVEDIQIEAGLWSMFGSQSGGADIRYKDGAGWILLLPNGDSYSGEGISSVYPSDFVAVGDKIFNCLRDAVSGALLDIATFDYINDGSFDFPVIKQSYLSDGDPHYFYYKLLGEDELINFQGGEYSAKGATKAVDNSRVEIEESFAGENFKWQLLPKKSEEFCQLEEQFDISLGTEGGVSYRVSRNNRTKEKIAGDWYRLKSGILVVLDKASRYTGQAFTIFDDTNDSGSDYNAEGLNDYGITTIYSESYYRIGYRKFFYYNLYTEVKIYWGEKWTPELVSGSLVYDKHYALQGQYFEAYYAGKGKEWWEDVPDWKAVPESERLVDLMYNGRQSLVFRENGEVEIYYDDELWNSFGYELKKLSNSYRVEFEYNVAVFYGPKEEVGYKNKNYIAVSALAIGSSGLTTYNTYSYSIADGANSVTHTYELYQIAFKIRP